MPTSSSQSDDRPVASAHRYAYPPPLARALDFWEASFHAVVERSVDGVVVVNTNGTICFANSAAERMLGRTNIELLGAAFGIPIVPGDTTEIDILQHGVPTRVAEMRVVATEWQRQPAYLATLRDVTERKSSEVDARRAVRRRDEFLAILSHELRNPLAAIANAAHVIRHSRGDSTVFERASDVIERQCRQMSRLLEDLLDVSRVTRGKIELHRECVDLKSAVREALDASERQFAARRVELEVTLPDDELLVDADAVRLHQVFVNLLSNAAKFSPTGQRVWLTVSATDEAAVISVRDNGLGMTEEHLSAVFEPFVQVDANLGRSEGGLGIGLALVRSLVELHDGRVVAASDGPGRGSEFTVYWPRSSAKPSTQTEQEAAHTSSPSSGLRILVVEDNDDVRNMLKMLLEMEQHEVEVAVDGRRALEIIEFQRPDVALVDIGLPQLDGYQVAEQVRSNSENDCVYLIALTGYGQKADRERALQAGFDEHLSKPVNLEQLSQSLARRAHTVIRTP